jgi:hypothetical protein
VVIGEVVSVSPQFAHSAQVIDAFGHRPLPDRAQAS